MKYLKVNMWGVEIGRLVWDASRRQAYFMANPKETDSAPDF